MTKTKCLIWMFAALCVGLIFGEWNGEREQKAADAVIFQEIRDQLLKADELPRPAVISALGLEVLLWDRGVVVDTWERESHKVSAAAIGD